MLKAVTRRQIDVVAAWSVDRLGRSLQDLVGFLAELNGAGCDLYLSARRSTPQPQPDGRLFQMLAVFAEFERAIITERINAGIARARQQGTASGKPIGRPGLSPQKEALVRAELGKGTGILRAAKLCGVGTGTVQRIRRQMASPQ